jgi:anti-sigma-K factor RskA
MPRWGALVTGDLHIDAGEYVIGTLDASERTAFTERLRGDAQARTAVASWEMRFADLADAIAPIVPPQRVWTGIERLIGQPEAKLHPFKVISGGGKVASVPAGLLASRNRWRLGALVSGAVAAVLAVFVADRTLRESAPETLAYVAAVNRGGDKPALLVRVDLRTRQVFVRPVAAETPAGKSLELWYIGSGEAPRSMGVIDSGPETLQLPKDGRADATTFAVSVEPAGGSKTGAPTGPVVYSGQLIKE